MAETPNNEQIRRMFELYSQTILAEIRLNKTAFANIVYEVRDDQDDDYFIRILKAQKPANVSSEIEVHKRLNRAGMVSPEYLRLEDGNFVGEVSGYSFTISKKIDGQVPEKISLGLVRDFGATLAKIHNALEGIELPESDLQWLNPVISKIDLDSYHGDHKSELSKMYQAGLKVFEYKLPGAVIHGDFWFGNVYAANDKITAVFDLETAEPNLRLVDIARTYLSMRTATDFSPSELQKALFDGYNSGANSQLNSDELRYFKLAECYAACVCAIWMLLHTSPNAERFVEYCREAFASIATS